MVFELILGVFDFFLRVSDNFIKLFDPFCDYPQDRGRFHKENTILNLLFRVFRSILIDFLTYCILCV